MVKVAVHTETTQVNRMYKASEHLPLALSLLFGLQQVATCISSIIVVPFVVSSGLCAGPQTYSIRSKLLSSALVISGVSTIIQTELGMRLALLQGPSYTFLPVIHSFLSRNRLCYNNTSINNTVLNSEYNDKLTVIAGSLMTSSLVPFLAGATGLVGAIRRFVGPITIATMLFLVMYSTVDIAVQYMAMHWISLLQAALLLLFIFYFYSYNCPVFCWKYGKFCMRKSRIFERYPYLIAFTITWTVCFICTLTGLTPPNSAIRLDRDDSVSKIKNARWIYFPIPNEFGKPKFSPALFVGCSVAAISTVIETIGTYYTAAAVSREPNPPSHALNRGMVVEGMSFSIGIGTLLAGFFGVGSGICTFSGNVGIMEITKVASRSMMIAAGLLLILIGLITKIGLIFAAIPDPLLGAVIVSTSAMTMGIALANLKRVDMSITRNMAVLGWSLMAGIMVPRYVDKYPLETGSHTINEIIKGFLSLPMFVGPIFAFILDNTVHGVSRTQRGFYDDVEQEGGIDANNVYGLPNGVMRCLQYFPILRTLPFIPDFEKRVGNYCLRGNQ